MIILKNTLTELTSLLIVDFGAIFNEFKGWAIFADGDMVCLSDIKENFFDPNIASVKHNYKTKHKTKYFGQKNELSRKNWSSVIIWNCEHPKNKILHLNLLAKEGSFLHGFIG